MVISTYTFPLWEVVERTQLFAEPLLPVTVRLPFGRRVLASLLSLGLNVVATTAHDLRSRGRLRERRFYSLRCPRRTARWCHSASAADPYRHRYRQGDETCSVCRCRYR